MQTSDTTQVLANLPASQRQAIRQRIIGDIIAFKERILDDVDLVRHDLTRGRKQKDEDVKLFLAAYETWWRNKKKSSYGSIYAELEAEMKPLEV